MPGAVGLTAEQAAAFERDGFLAIPGFATPEEVAALRARADEIIQSADLTTAAASIFSTVRQQKQVHRKTAAAAAAEDETDERQEDSPASDDSHFLSSASTVSVFLEEKAVDPVTGAVIMPRESCVNKLGHAGHDIDPTFRSFSRSAAVAAVLRSLGYVKPLPVQSMYILKGPKIGGEVSPHRDDSFLATIPEPSVVGLWLALERADRSNGCLWAVPGSHRDGGGAPERRFVLREEEEEADGGDGAGEAGAERGKTGDGGGSGETKTQTKKQKKKKKRLAFTAPQPEHDLTPAAPIECEAGTLVLLHGHVLHYSGENTSAVSRHSYTTHVVEGGKGLQWAPDNWLQRDDGFVPLYDDSAVH